MTKDEALRLALDWFKCYQEKSMSRNNAEELANELITAIEAALEAKDEPVAWAWRAFDPDEGHDGKWGSWHISDYKPPRQQSRWFQVVPLPSTTPPQQEAKDEPDWKALVLNHNADCESRCDMERCKYKPYFEHNGRRCPDCPVHETIDVDYIPTQRTWVGLDEKDFAAINQSCLTKLQAATSAESILKEKNT